MRKHYLILVLFFLAVAMLKADARDRGNPSNHVKNKSEMTPCDPPIVNADTLLLQYLTNEPLTAVGGVPPYTYTFSPAISTSSLVALLTSTVTTVYTITVTGANGCDSIYHATYIPLPGETTGACTTPFLSEYIQDTVPNPSGDGINDAIELYNPTYGTINLNGYYLIGTTNSSLYATPFFIALHGTIAAHKTFLIANTNADTALIHKAGMLSDSLSFRGKDIVALAKISLTPTVTFSFLDEVGAITPLPTDSGWAVGSGSTKNHTLVRQTSVTQGDLNWSTCKNEWNVYPRGTFTYVGSYTNVCTPEDPYLYLTLGNDSVICGEPSYFNFDVLIQADSAQIFNDGAFTVKFSGDEFTGDDSHSGIDVSLGDDFQQSYYNPISLIESGNSIYVQIGDPSQFSYAGTVIDSVPKILAHISLEIHNSCAPGAITFDKSTRYNWQYTQETKTFTHMDSIKTNTYDTSYYVCGTTTGPPYLCPVCCDTDMYGNCDSICYLDTCTIYNVYCIDTIWHYRPDSAFAYTNDTNKDYSNIYYLDTLTAYGCPMSMDATNTPVNAGTNAKSIPNNSSLLIITGIGFGTTPDSVIVTNADGPGTCRLDRMDIQSWEENKIELRMPSYVQEDTISSTTHTPGTGPIQVYNACGGSASSNLRINYNIKDSYQQRTKEKTRLSIVMSNSNNSLVFRCDTSVSHNAQAYACVKKAIRKWNCYTGVNWKIGSDTTLEVSNADNVSLIYFSNSNFPDTSTLMVTNQQILPTHACYDGGDSLAFYHEADINMRLDRYLPSYKHWNYDTTYASASPNYYYFYDVIMHELGHAHGLGHINDQSSLMYWGTAPGRRDSITGCNLYPGPATLYGAFDMINTGIAWDPGSLPPDFCTFNKLVTDTRECTDPTMSVPNISGNPYNLNLYPNPISYGDITVTYDLSQNAHVQFTVFDCTGRAIMNVGNENKPSGTYSVQVNTNNLAEGVYLFVANINGEIKTIKFVKL